MAERAERAKDKTEVTPEPVRPDLFKFLEGLFDGPDQKPEKIEVRQAYGLGLRKYGVQVTDKEFKPGATKPSREALVRMSNEFCDLAQNNCNNIGKPHKYGVCAKHYAKSDSYYRVFVIALIPKQPPEGAYDGTLSEEEDEFGVMSDAKRRDALLEYSLAHLKTGDEHERYRQDQFSTATGDLLEKYQNLAAQLMTHNLELQREHRELFKTTDEALSRKAERDLAAEMQRFKISAMGDAFQFLKQMAPVAINQITGKETVPTKQSAESIAVKGFLEGLSESQAISLFGEFDAATKELKPTGIFTPAQAAIFYNVGECNLPSSALDQLLEGPNAVTQEQLAKAPTVISSQQFMPLVALIMTRKKNQLESPAPQPPAAPPNTPSPNNP